MSLEGKIPALLAALDCKNHVHLIIGLNPVASARCTRSLEVGASVKLLAPAETILPYGLRKHIDENKIEWIRRDFLDSDLTSLGREDVDKAVDAVFIALPPGDSASIHISNLCRRLRIPVNVADAPSLSTFTLLSTYRDGPLQIGTTTSGRGCKLASRIRREVSSALPSGLGAAIDRLGRLRRRIWEEDQAAELFTDLNVKEGSKQQEQGEQDGEEEDSGQSASFNKLVTLADAEAAKTRRIRWLAQICEYWPLQRLATVTDADIDEALRSFTSSEKSGFDPAVIDGRRRLGQVILAGSGPGNPDLLTIAAHKAILSADLVLADKLVPAPVMDLVPRRAEVHIARKFPGNADKAQEELLELGLAGLKAGKTVVRIKQGDPYVYGRGAEEYAFFRANGHVPMVIPGITSALSAPLFGCIPPTHRGVADQILICTGTGRQGALPEAPSYVETQTVLLLMALHRLSAVVENLTSIAKKWPKNTPCAVIERASCRDQRIIRTTLEYVCAAVEEEGSRPPGLLVLGKSCEVLHQSQKNWVVEDGFTDLDPLHLTMLDCSNKPPANGIT